MADNLTQGQVQEVIEFSQALYAAEASGLYSPWLSNQLLQNLNNKLKTKITRL